MSTATRPSAAIVTATFAVLCSPVLAQPATPPADEHAGHAHGPFDHHHDSEFTMLPPALGANLFDGWFDEWPHTHYSRRGVPFVHTFGSEPAFMGRHLFLDYSLRKGAEGTEMEIEAELEYALTRRIGLVIEAPYVFLNPKEEDRENGIGDFAIAPRFLLMEFDRFLLSANLELSFPTGDEDKDLGSGETAIHPSLSSWIDLGANFAFQSNLGIEHAFRSDSDTLTWGAALTYSMYLNGEPELINTDAAVRAHFPAGMLSLIAEINGEHPFDGEESGSGTADIILGASYTLTPHLEVRGALTFPAFNPREFDSGFILSLIYHF